MVGWSGIRIAGFSLQHGYHGYLWVGVVSALQAVACNTDTTLLYLNLLFISIQCDLIVLLYKFSSSLYTVFIHL